MSDSYYELLDTADQRGEKFRATDMVRGTWSADIQHAAPVSALLVRALGRDTGRCPHMPMRALILSNINAHASILHWWRLQAI